MSHSKRQIKTPRTSKASLIKKKRNGSLASVAHQARIPLNAIIGFSEMMLTEKTGSINPEQREYLKDIIFSAKDLLRLIKHAAEQKKERRS